MSIKWTLTDRFAQFAKKKLSRGSERTARANLFRVSSTAVLAIVILLAALPASACLPDPAPNPSSPAATAISSLLAALTAQANPRPIGCFLCGPIDVPGSDGVSSEFENGQIVWSPRQQMVLAAYWSGNEQSGTISVQWQMLVPVHYDFFLIRRQDVALPASKAIQEKLPSASGSINLNTHNVATGGNGLPDSRYFVIVEGCNTDGSRPVQCDQGWSAPAYVDVNPIDVMHDVSGNPLLPATTPIATSSTFDSRVTLGFFRTCNLGFPQSFAVDIYSAWLALGKLYLATNVETLPTCGTTPNVSETKTTLIKETNDWLRNAKVNSEVGTDFKVVTAGEGGLAGLGVGAVAGFEDGGLLGAAVGAIIGGVTGDVTASNCYRQGDYDMALFSLLPLMNEFGDKLDADVYHHVLHDLLTQSGGVKNVRTSFSACGVVNVAETENHIMNTESARYLTNQLLFAEVAQQYVHDPQSPVLAAATNEYDNTVNGLQSWMLSHLQRFAQNDFHEYNARPYMNLSIAGIHNLAEYASDSEVKTAATIVLNYLTAKLAVSSSGFRRATPFRRHYAARDFPLLFEEWNGDSTNHDQAIWWEATMFGTTQLVEALRQGHLEARAEADMSVTSFGHYRVPDLVLDIIMRDEITAPAVVVALPPPTTPFTYFQVFRHEGVELYARDPNLLITAGGDWEDNTRQDQVPPFTGVPSSNGAALPTTLMPAWAGTSLADLIQIAGNSESQSHLRANSCVAPGFACGLNPTIPASFFQKVQAAPPPMWPNGDWSHPRQMEPSGESGRPVRMPDERAGELWRRIRSAAV
jgi:hypothetical protein